MSRRPLPPLHLAAPFVAFLTDLAKTQAVYIVGGWLRDGLRGASAQDADFATDALEPSVRRLADAHGLKIFADKVAEQHGTYRMTSGVPFEVLDLATLRCDVAREGARHAQVAFTDDIVLDLARRDLTINGMAAIYPLVTPTRGDILDPFGGQEDLAGGRLRLIGVPHKRLEEDPLRLLRVARFACLGRRWRIVASTRHAMRRRATWLARISFERIREELKKSLALAAPERFWDTMRTAGVLKHVWPMPPEFRYPAARHALRHSRTVADDPLFRLCVYMVAGARPRQTFNSVAAERLQRAWGERASAAWLRLKGASADAQLLRATVSAYPWDPDALTGEALVSWLLTHGDATVRRCRAITLVLVRAQQARKRPIDALWRRVDRLLDGSSVPTLSSLAIDGRALAQRGIVQEGPQMGDMLRRLLHWGLLTGSWQNAEAMTARAQQMAATSLP